MTLAEIITDLFHFRDQVHIWHLQTDSYAAHMALGGFYEDVQGQIDRLAENFIAQQAVLEATKINIPAFANYDTTIIMKAFQEYLLYLEAIKAEMKLGALHNILDDMSELGNQTLYLLRLK